MKSKQEVNEVTGRTVIVFEAELVSISENTLENVNGTLYRVATVKFEDVNGIERQVSAMVYNNNYQKDGEIRMQIGEKYRTVADKVGENVYLIMSHLSFSAARADVAMFDFAEQLQTTTSKTEVTSAVIAD